MLNKETEIKVFELAQTKDRIPRVSIKDRYIHKWGKPFESKYKDDVQKLDRIVEILTSDKFDARNYLEEYSWLVCMKTHGELIGIYELGHGGLTRCVIDSREVFMKASLVGSLRVAIVHNHPSGDPTPSKADKEVTALVKTVLQDFSGIYLYDHIIIGMNGETSMLNADSNARMNKDAYSIINSGDMYIDTVDEKGE